MVENPIAWETDYARALERVRAERKHLFVFYHKPNCGGCILLERTTFPDPQVAAFLSENFIAYAADLAVKADWPLFRENNVIWTPSIGCGDRKGRLHYISPGYFPPAEFIDALRIGLARCLMAWTRHSEAAAILQPAIETGGTMAPEALFWLGTAYYFERRDSAPMYDAWATLRRLYPDSQWAKRTYERVTT